MSLLYYDKAVFKKVHQLYDEIFFASPEEAFKTNAKAHGGKVLMPFIGVWRMPDFTVNRDMYNEAYVRKGPRARSGSSNGIEYKEQIVRMHGLPISLSYQIDVYSVSREACDGIAAELLVEFFEHPYVDVYFPCISDDYHMQFNVDVDDNVADNTSISEFEESNRFYRLSITLLLNEAVIYRVSQTNKIFESVLITFKDLDTGNSMDSAEE